MIHEFLRILGLTDASGGWYLFWSGVFGDVTIFGAGVLLYRKHNCHVHRCWRISRHVTPEGHAVCRTHNPDGHLTHAHLLHLHATRRHTDVA